MDSSPLYFLTQERFVGKVFRKSQMEHTPPHGQWGPKVLLYKMRNSFLICSCRFQLEEACLPLLSGYALINRSPAANTPHIASIKFYFTEGG